MNKLSRYVIINIIVVLFFTILFSFLTEGVFFIVLLIALCGLYYVFCEINIYKYKLMGMYKVHQTKKNRFWGAFLTIINILYAFIIIQSAISQYSVKSYFSDRIGNTNDEMSFTVKRTSDIDSVAIIIANNIAFDKVDTSMLQSIIRDTFSAVDSQFVVFIAINPNPDIEIEVYNYTKITKQMKGMLISIGADGIINNINNSKSSRFVNQELIWQYIIVSDSLGY